MNTNLKNELKFLTKPTLILSAILILIIVVSLFSYNQISNIQSKIQVAEKNKKTLEQKIATLETVDAVLSGDITFLDVVLPSKGAVLYGMSQVKNQAILSNVAISNLKTGTPVIVTQGISKVSIGFDVEGEESSIYAFLQSFAKILPLMNVDKVNLSKSSSLVRATVSLNVYSAEFPKKIPAVTESINEFSSAEVQTLKEVSEYTLPVFIEPLVSTEANTKTNPFGEE